MYKTSIATVHVMAFLIIRFPTILGQRKCIPWEGLNEDNPKSTAYKVPNGHSLNLYVTIIHNALMIASLFSNMDTQTLLDASIGLPVFETPKVYPKRVPPQCEVFAVIQF